MSGITVAIIGGFLLIVATVAVCVFDARNQLTTPIRVLISALCIPVAMFSVFGFLASFEPGVAIGWKVGYAILFATNLAVGVALWIRRSGPADRSAEF